MCSLTVLRVTPVFEVTPELCAGTSGAYDPVGGMQNDVAQLTRALDSEGVVQTVVTTYRPGLPRRDLIGQHGNIIRLGVHVRRLRQLYSLPGVVRIPRLAHGANLVHAHLGEDLAVVPLALLAAACNRLPLVLTIHLSLSHTLEVSDLRSRFLKGLGGRLEELGRRRAQALVLLSACNVESLIEEGVPRERVHVIPQSVDLTRFQYAEPTALDGIPQPRILFVGRLVAQKSVETLILAVPYLPSGAQIIIVGDGPERNRLTRLARRLAVHHRVHFCGSVPPQRIPSFLAGADLFVMPSRYEELGTAILEAMAAELPVVASNTGGIPHIIENENTGLLVPPRDP